MANKPVTIEKAFSRDDISKYVANLWNTWNVARQPMLDAWKEQRDYIFATDTTTTSNSTLPWKNSTTLPKLCQIRDNLHSNYISALFPNDDWLKWEAYTKDSGSKDKTEAIEAYMSNKARMSNMRTVVSRILLDYIDYGNAFSTVTYENTGSFLEDGTYAQNYVGPKLVRISPLDIVFDPTADTFIESAKIIRSLRSVAWLNSLAQDRPEDAYLQKILSRRNNIVENCRNGFLEDSNKRDAYLADGFGNYDDYMRGEIVEVLTFYGDIYDSNTKAFLRNQIITIIDRSWVINKTTVPSWLGHAPIYHAGWRLRPDNLWAMSPLENLVGMQYRIDHLENLKADAMDLAILPPLKILGEVEEFTWGPGAEIHIDEGGDVVELGKNAQWVIQANNEINYLTTLMEQYAGAPSEAMGIRTPGEKTAFEVQQLQNAAGRIFQEKVNNFELNILEFSLNAMLEVARRSMDKGDVIRVMDDDLGVERFVSITREDIVGSGKIRPVGARHFAAQAQLVQNLNGIFGGPIGQMIAPHVSNKQLAKVVEDVMGFSRYQLISPNIAIFEQQETQRLASQAQEDLHAEANSQVPMQ